MGQYMSSTQAVKPEDGSVTSINAVITTMGNIDLNQVNRIEDYVPGQIQPTCPVVSEPQVLPHGPVTTIIAGDPAVTIVTTSTELTGVPALDGPVLAIKYCPRCGVATDKIDGCNFIDCKIGDRTGYINAPPEKQLKPEDICNQLWCFECGMPKYEVIRGKEYLGSCNDISHNSH